MKVKFFSILVSLFFIASCASTEKMLAKTWRIDEVVFIDSLNTFSQEQKEMISKAMKTNLYFGFWPDSVYLVSNSGEQSKSKWWLSKNKKTLYTIAPDGKIVESKLLRLNKSYLEFQSKDATNAQYRFSCSPVTNSK